MSHHKPRIEDAFLNRREFLRRSGMGMGALTLGSMLAGNPAFAANPLDAKAPHFPGKAKRVIHFFLNGGPSAVDTFDYKPELEKYAGKGLPMEYLRTERKTGAAFPSPASAPAMRRGQTFRKARFPGARSAPGSPAPTDGCH